MGQKGLPEAGGDELVAMGADVGHPGEIVDRCPDGEGDEDGYSGGNQPELAGDQAADDGAGEYQADERAVVARLSWRVSGR